MEKTQLIQRIKTDLLMLLIAVIWGSAFSFQQLAGKQIGAFLIVGIRFLGAAILLFIMIRFRLRLPLKVVWQSAGAGLLLFSASALQQFALQVSTVGNAGFITGMYVVFIPVFLALIWKKRLRWNVWWAVVLVVAGLYLLTNSGVNTFSLGDLLLVGCAILYALQMITLGKLVQVYDPLQVSLVQFAASGFAGFFFAILFEDNSWSGLWASFWPMLYMIVPATGIAFTLQGVAQQHAEPTDAAIFLSMESVFAALFGVIFLGESFSAVQWVGSLLMFTAMVLSQITVVKTLPSASFNNAVE